MNIKKGTILAKIGLILLLVLSFIFTYNSISDNWKLLGIPYSILSILDLIGSIFLLVFIYNFSFKIHYALKFKTVINLGIIGCGLLSITAVLLTINRISLQSQYNSQGMSFGFIEILSYIIPIAVNILLLLSIYRLRVFKKPNALKYSFILGIVSSILAMVIPLINLMPNYNRWNEFKNTFYSRGDGEYQQIFINVFDLLDIPRFFISLITITSYTLLTLFFVKALNNREAILEFFKSKRFEKNTTTDQNIKPNNIKNIILSTLLLAAFFMPWIKILGFGGSAFDLIKEVVKNIKLLDKEPMGILIFLLLLFPICSLIILINYSKSELKTTQIKILQFAKKTPLILIVVTIIVALIKLSKGLEFIKMKDLGNIFEIMGIGLIITLISSIILFFDKTTISKNNSEKVLEEEKN